MLVTLDYDSQRDTGGGVSYPDQGSCLCPELQHSPVQCRTKLRARMQLLSFVCVTENQGHAYV